LRTHFHPIRTLVLVALSAAITSLAMAPLASAGNSRGKSKAPVGYVATETNDPGGNRLVVFSRDSKGTLRQIQSLRTGGDGTTQDVGCGPGCPILDSQGAVDMTSNGQLIFAVNGGSDTVTSFRRSRNGFRRVDTQSSGGDLPLSLVARDGLLYVLNTNDGTISGIRYTSNGRMSAIPNSTKPIAGQGQNQVFPSGGARQIGFDNSGDWVIVSELATVLPPGPPPGAISAFKLNSNGTTDPAVSTKSATPLPFGFAFDRRNNLIMSEVNDPAGATDGSVTSYSFNGSSGAVTPINTLTSGGALPCWVVITRNGRYAFVINTGAGRPAGAAKYGIGSDGTLTSRGVTTAPSGTFLWTDPALSRDSKYLYVLAPTGPGPGGNTSHIDAYKVSSRGGLRFIRSTRSNLPAGVSGLDGR
jgi:6-phosphogluconolactonase (cycloisomerase 2 family)